MVSQEVRDRLDHLPHAILRLASLRLSPGQRTAVYENEWLPELAYILKGDEARPVTRLYHSLRFGLGILMAARRIGRELPQPQADRVLLAGLDTTLLPRTVGPGKSVLISAKTPGVECGFRVAPVSMLSECFARSAMATWTTSRLPSRRTPTS